MLGLVCVAGDHLPVLKSQIRNQKSQFLRVSVSPWWILFFSKPSRQPRSRSVKILRLFYCWIGGPPRGRSSGNETQKAQVKTVLFPISIRLIPPGFFENNRRFGGSASGSE